MEIYTKSSHNTYEIHQLLQFNEEKQTKLSQKNKLLVVCSGYFCAQLPGRIRCCYAVIQWVLEDQNVEEKHREENTNNNNTVA